MTLRLSHAILAAATALSLAACQKPAAPADNGATAAPADNTPAAYAPANAPANTATSGMTSAPAGNGNGGQDGGDTHKQ